MFSDSSSIINTARGNTEIPTSAVDRYGIARNGCRPTITAFDGTIKTVNELKYTVNYNARWYMYLYVILLE